MTKREQYSFILNILLPAVEREGMTIKTRRDGELTIRPTDPAVVNFISEMRRSLEAELQRPIINTVIY